MAPQPKHILLASPPLYGHAIPLLHLGLKLTHFHRVTLAVYSSTARGLRAEVKDAVHGQYGPVRIVGIETANSEDVIDLKSDNPARALFEGLCPTMRELFSTIPIKNQKSAKPKLFSLDGEGILEDVDVVIVDNFLGGPVSLVHQRGIPYYLFCSARAWLALAFLTLNIEDPDSLKQTTTVPPKFVRRSVGRKFLDNNFEANKDLLMDNCETMHLAQGIIVNAVRESENEFLADILAEKGMENCKIYCVGPLATETVEKASPKKPDEVLITHWLDSQDKSRVVYVSFGSVASPSPADVKEIGEALLQLKTPFIWSLKAAHYGHLPEQIQATMKEPENGKPRPFLIVPWAPQKEILEHASTGVFVSHCGWNSTLEALMYGVPVVAWPMFADQLINAVWLEEQDVGKLIPGTDTMSGAPILAGTILEVLQEVTQLNVGKERNSFLTAAKQWKEKIVKALAVGGSSHEELNQLAQL